MIKEVASIDLPVHERMVVRKNRLTPQDYTGGSVPRISIVTGTHGDELDGQYICYEIIRRINKTPNKLKGIIDIYPDINPLGIDIGSRGIPMFELASHGDILPNLQLTGYPVGYSNQGQAITVNSDEDTVIMPGEEKEIVIYFTVANSPSRPVNQKKLIKSDFYIDLSVYPDHKAIVFHGVDDSCDIDD